MEVVRLQYTDIGGNNNKFYLVEFDGELARVTWGRVGASGQKKTYTKHQARRKIEEKKAKGYVEVKLHTPRVVFGSSNVDPRLEDVAANIAREAGQHISTYLAASVDALSQQQIDAGRRILLEVVRLNGSVSRRRLHEMVEEFYRTIPTRLPPRIHPDEVINNFVENLDETENRLNQLEAAIEAMAVTSSGASNYQALGAELEFMDKSDPMYAWIANYITSTLVHGYRAEIVDILTVKIPAEREAYEKDPTGQPLALFHGTAGANVSHILRSGLIVPRTASNGRMFGSGIYFANTFSKSANYSSTREMPYKITFLADVKLGNPWIAPDADTSLTRPPNGLDSVWGKKDHTRSWGGRLRFDEFIVYRPSQQTIKYAVLWR